MREPGAERRARRCSRTLIVALFAAGLLLLLFGLERYFSHRRWDIKTLSDPGRGSVRMTPVDATVSRLASIARPRNASFARARMPPWETTVYRVRGRLIAIHRELDQDVHLVLVDRDDPSKSMVVEIPGPSETAESAMAERFRRARGEVDAHTRGEKPEGGWPVRVTGVGFFDFPHFQPGAAGTGFELHPVVEIEFEAMGAKRP